MNKTLVHQEVIELMEKWAPQAYAYDWDPVGLQVGSLKAHLNHILVTLDVTEAVVDEAIKKNANLIIAHHPLLFRPVSQIDTDSVKGGCWRNSLSTT
ncbi:GTP cyclohydrolase 1 type 2 like protein [Lentibacillus sp. JNUCC-1]|nr:GTP cyclohydrolase 1 type 2 like protein [Lentibacillus sp. JNUCC-1]